jgi:hypothetical protein
MEVSSTYVMKLTPEPTVMRPRFTGRNLSAAIFKTSRSGVEAGASLMRSRFLATPGMFCRTRKYQKLPSILGFGC